MPDVILCYMFAIQSIMHPNTDPLGVVLEALLWG